MATLDPFDVSARSQQSAYSETGDMSAICAACTGPVMVDAYYNDRWQTPLTLAPVGITDATGVLLPGQQGGPSTLGLMNFGAVDGDASVPGLRPDAGTFLFAQAQSGPVTVTLPADPGSAEHAAELEASIISSVEAFARTMETSLQPWIDAWEDTGWWGAVRSFFSGIRDGLAAWWEGEGDFWGTVWETIKSIPDAIVSGATALYDWSRELWANRDKIFDLFQAFADGAVDVAQGILETLVNLPGELNELIGDLVERSAEWAGAMNEMLTRTRVLDVLFATVGAIVFAIPPNFWAESLGRVGGFIIPELIISAIFLVIAVFTGGTGGGALATRLIAFSTRTMTTLRSAGRAGRMIVRVFDFIMTVMQKMVDLVYALKRSIDEVVESATDVVTRVVRRTGRRVDPPARLPCFNQPPNATRQEFLDQLQEQENAINNSNISELMDRRAAVIEQGTGALRDHAAQQAARNAWLEQRINGLIADGELLSDATRIANAEAARLHATHVLDIVAGGDPSDISGLQNASVNSSIGSQWRSRVGSLDEALADQAARGGQRANVRLRPC